MDLPVRVLFLLLHLFISVNQRPSAFQSRAPSCGGQAPAETGFAHPSTRALIRRRRPPYNAATSRPAD